MSDAHEAGQLDMLPGLRASVAAAKTEVTETSRRQVKEQAPAEVDPVARVLVDVPLAHLDRPFDYLVPLAMAETAVPGARVKVRFAGQDVDGFVVERATSSDHPGTLQPLRRVVSGEPVLTPAIQALSGELAIRYAGARADVLRLAVPPRHATTEKAPPLANALPVVADLAAALEAWRGHEPAEPFLSHLATGGSPRAVWQALPGADWPAQMAHAAALTASSGRGVVLCVPDHRDVARVAAALTAVVGADQFAVLTADLGPARRYEAFLSVVRGQRRIVVGTRSAAFAPVADLGLVAIWDDGDDLHAEPRAPYPHTREVLLTRAEHENAAVLLGGLTRTVEAEYLVRTGWAHALGPARALVRESVRVDLVATDEQAKGARVPGPAVKAVRQALEHGPVLVQTPRAGYAAHLGCERCRTPARCQACRGPLRLAAATDPPTCGWCGVADPAWACRECGHRGLRAPVIGRDRTAEEMGRMFPGHTVRSSGGDRVLSEVGVSADVVVATPGAEPVARRGYEAVLLLDTWLSLGRSDLRSDEEAVRRWFNAAGLVRPGGRVIAMGDPSLPLLQTLVRWDPAGFAGRELESRQSAHLPPAVRLASVAGLPDAVEEAMALVDLPPVAEVLGPVPVPSRQETDDVRLVIRVPRHLGPALSQALGDMQRARSARRLAAVRVQIDPLQL